MKDNDINHTESNKNSLNENNKYQKTRNYNINNINLKNNFYNNNVNENIGTTNNYEDSNENIFISNQSNNIINQDPNKNYYIGNLNIINSNIRGNNIGSNSRNIGSSPNLRNNGSNPTYSANTLTLKSFCCGKNRVSYLWKIILSIICFLIIVVCLIEYFKVSKKRKIRKINRQGIIPTIDNSNKNTSEYCTNEEIEYFAEHLDNLDSGKSTDSISKRVNKKEESCKNIRFNDERCITCFIEENKCLYVEEKIYCYKCILINNYTIYNYFKKGIVFDTSGKIYTFKSVYCRDSYIIFKKIYIVLMFLFIYK